MNSTCTARTATRVMMVGVISFVTGTIMENIFLFSPLRGPVNISSYRHNRKRIIYHRGDRTENRFHIAYK